VAGEDIDGPHLREVGKGEAPADPSPPIRRRPVTLLDVAREAGTSPSTASRALTGSGYVSEDARERLLEAADRLGYVRNAWALALKQRRSKVVGVVVSELGNQFYAGLAAGIEETLRGAGYQMLLVSDNSDSEQELAVTRTFLALRAAGVILTPVGSSAAAFLNKHGVDAVEVDRQLATVPCDAVVIDNESGARAATAHLLALGHRRIALLVVETDWTSDAGRLQGYRVAHEEAGVAVDERLIVRIELRAPDAAARIAALLDVEGPTAIFAANNALAEVAWNVLRQRGLQLPDDVSLVAFDDVPWMSMVTPSITAVSQPTLELGRRAAQLLLRRLGEPNRPPALEVLQPTVVIRGSTGRLA
jgi:LacI family transcriptional regulator